MRELTATTCWVVLALQWTAVACSNHDLRWKDTNAPPASFEGDAGEVDGKPGIGGGAATSGEGAGAGAGELGGSASGGALSSEGSQGGAGMKGEGGAADVIPTERVGIALGAEVRNAILAAV